MLDCQLPLLNSEIAIILKIHTSTSGIPHCEGAAGGMDKHPIRQFIQTVCGFGHSGDLPNINTCIKNEEFTLILTIIEILKILLVYIILKWDITLRKWTSGYVNKNEDYLFSGQFLLNRIKLKNTIVQYVTIAECVMQ